MYGKKYGKSSTKKLRKKFAYFWKGGIIWSDIFYQFSMNIHKKKEFFLQKARKRDGESFYSARDMILLCGYDKWERFRGCIDKTIKGVKDEKLIPKEEVKKHFLFKTTNTGGRPKEDILLSLWAVEQLLTYCDERKEEVSDMKQIVSDIRSGKEDTSSPQSPETESFGGNFLFIVIAILALLFGAGIYFSSTLTQKQVITEEENDEIFTQQQKELEEIQKYEISQHLQKYSPELEDYIEQVPQNPTGGGEIVARDIEEYQQENPDFNYRTEFVNRLAGEKLIEAFFAFGNEKLYRDACGILTPNACNPRADDLSPFSRFWNRTVNGYENISISHVQDNDQEQIYCVTYTYKLRDDLVDADIMEIFHFNTYKDGDLEQITGRYCESVEK